MAEAQLSPVLLPTPHMRNREALQEGRQTAAEAQPANRPAYPATAALRENCFDFPFFRQAGL